MTAPTTTRPTRLHNRLTGTYLDWLEAPIRARQERALETLEGIKADEGPLWALFASAYVHGPLIREWRIALVVELEERL